MDPTVAAARWVFDICWADLERLVAEFTEEQLHRRVAPGVNSVADVLQHLCGSQHRLLGGAVGGLPVPQEYERERDFQGEASNKEQLGQAVVAARALCSEVLAALRPEQLAQPGFRWPRMDRPATKWETVQRVLSHVAHHRGQVALLASLLRASTATAG